jgi:uncharacterized YkwD family protein
MNKKIIFSIAAAAALLVSTPGMNKAEAASPVNVQSEVYVYQTGDLNQEQMNSILQKYMNTSQINLKSLQDGNQSISQLVQNLQKQINEQSAANQKQPVQQQPVQKPVQQKPVQQQPVQKPVQQKPVQKPVQQKPASSTVSAFEQQVLDLTNQERAKSGLKPLTLDVELSKVAREKSRDMQTKGYFDHNSPTYGSPFDMMKKFGISYRSAGENIAQGQRSPQEVVTAWMNSEGHRANILSSNFTHIGIGHVAEGNYWTQMFIGK